jgi:hypothetical protein
MVLTLMRIRRPARVALVYGAPDYEENSLAAAVHLADRYTGRVVLLCADLQATRGYLHHVGAVLGIDASRVELVRKRSFADLPVFASAELAFYTHGLFFSPAPLGRRLHVNLWHGTGPKSSVLVQLRSTYFPSLHSAASRPWGESTARSLGMPASTAVIPGNARQDLVRAPADVRGLSLLGLRSDQPFVVWMPTYRRSDDISLMTLSEGVSLLTPTGELSAADLGAAAERAGVQLVVKPHPKDHEQLASLGLPLLTSEQVWAAGLSVGELMGAAAGMVSDYSSAWVDFLGLRRSVGLYCPDLPRYAADRGFNDPPLDVVAAGLFLRTAGDLDEFFGAIAAGSVWREAELTACADALEVRDARPATGRSRTGELLDAVREAGLARHGHDFNLHPPA